jgi:predicted phosphodiesterase
MKLLILSDLHLEFQARASSPGNVAVNVAAHVADGCDAVVLAGDIQAPGHRGVAWAAAEPAFAGKPVFYVPGNHEYYGQVWTKELAAMRAAAQGTNVQVLDRDVVTLVSGVESDAGQEPVRVLGATLWTDLRLKVLGADGQWRRDARLAAAEAGVGLNDFSVIRVQRSAPESGVRRLRPLDTVQWHHAARQWLLARLAEPWAGRTVVVTHHAPHPGSLAGCFERSGLSPAFVNDLPAACFQGVDLWVHGHTHDSFDYPVDRPDGGTCRVVCNPRGYVRWDGALENRAFETGWVVTV